MTERKCLECGSAAKEKLDGQDLEALCNQLKNWIGKVVLRYLLMFAPNVVTYL